MFPQAFQVIIPARKEFDTIHTEGVCFYLFACQCISFSVWSQRSEFSLAPGSQDSPCSHGLASRQQNQTQVFLTIHPQFQAKICKSTFDFAEYTGDNMYKIIHLRFEDMGVLSIYLFFSLSHGLCLFAHIETNIYTLKQADVKI